MKISFDRVYFLIFLKNDQNTKKSGHAVVRSHAHANDEKESSLYCWLQKIKLNRNSSTRPHTPPFPHGPIHHRSDCAMGRSDGCAADGGAKDVRACLEEVGRGGGGGGWPGGRSRQAASEGWSNHGGNGLTAVGHMTSFLWGHA
jgi:hypothetical protein